MTGRLFTFSISHFPQFDQLTDIFKFYQQDCSYSEYQCSLILLCTEGELANFTMLLSDVSGKRSRFVKTAFINLGALPFQRYKIAPSQSFACLLKGSS